MVIVFLILRGGAVGELCPHPALRSRARSTRSLRPAGRRGHACAISHRCSRTLPKLNRPARRHRSLRSKPTSAPATLVPVEPTSARETLAEVEPTSTPVALAQVEATSTPVTVTITLANSSDAQVLVALTPADAPVPSAGADSELHGHARAYLYAAADRHRPRRHQPRAPTMTSVLRPQHASSPRPRRSINTSSSSPRRTSPRRSLAARGAQQGVTLDNLKVRFAGGKTHITADKLGYGFINMQNLDLVGSLAAQNGVLSLAVESISHRGLAANFVPGAVDQALARLRFAVVRGRSAHA